MKENPKIYLDTNIILGWFKGKAQERRGKIFSIPKRLVSLQDGNYALFVSTLVKTEVYRYLRSEWQLDKLIMDELWDEFKIKFSVTEIVIQKLEVNLIKILEITNEIALKKTDLIDLMHLQISEKNDIKFLTDEGDLNKLNKFYKNIIILEDL